jgi:hypothetical protein
MGHEFPKGHAFGLILTIGSFFAPYVGRCGVIKEDAGFTVNMMD